MMIDILVALVGTVFGLAIWLVTNKLDTKRINKLKLSQQNEKEYTS